MRYLTVKEFASLTGASVSTVRRAIFENRLAVERVPVSKSGHAFRVLIPESAVATYCFRLPAREAMRRARLATDTAKG